MSEHRYRFGPFVLDVRLACLHRGDAAVPLRPKSFALLQYLVRNAGRIVTKEELMSALWPKVVVTDDSLTRCVSDVRAALDDSAQLMIRTVSRRGYVFAAPVAKFDFDERAPTTAVDALRRRDPVSAWRRWSPLLALFSVLAVAVTSFAMVNRPDRLAPRLSLIVLPFTDLHADPAEDYLSEVVTNDLTAALARLRGFVVIASSTAFTLKGRHVDMKRLGMDVGVRYALEGSVSRSERRVRINVSLLDTQTATTLWTDRFDVDRADLLRTQDEIVTRLANALHAELVQADSRRSTLIAAADLDAEDLAMQCEAASYRLADDENVAGVELCERALKRDPDNVRALVRLALYHARRVSRVQSPDPAADLERAETLITRALANDGGYYAAHCARAVVLEGRRRMPEAIAAAERCLELNPSYAGAYLILAIQHFFLAQPEKSLEFASHGIRLSPHDPQLSTFLLFNGWARFMMGQDDDALLWLRRAAAAAPETPPIIAGLTSVLALTGHDLEAQATLERYLALEHTKSRTIAQWNYRPDDNAEFARFDARFKSGLRRAGMPEK